jgi:Lon protease-like protein
LIERGSEVGGGEHRFPVGTIAQITDLDAAEEFVVLMAEGTRRVEVTQWLSDDPYPRAEVRVLDDLVWSDALLPLREKAERAVRALLTLATELTGDGWPSDILLADDPVAACWQLAAIAPLGPLDQVELLASPDLATLLVTLVDFVAGAEESFRALYP